MLLLRELVEYLRDLLDRPGVKILIGCLAFGTSFTVGFVSEMGYGLYVAPDAVGNGHRAELVAVHPAVLPTTTP